MHPHKYILHMSNFHGSCNDYCLFPVWNGTMWYPYDKVLSVTWFVHVHMVVCIQSIYKSQIGLLTLSPQSHSQIPSISMIKLPNGKTSTDIVCLSKKKIIHIIFPLLFPLPLLLSLSLWFPPSFLSLSSKPFSSKLRTIVETQLQHKLGCVSHFNTWTWLYGSTLTDLQSTAISMQKTRYIGTPLICTFGIE